MQTDLKKSTDYKEISYATTQQIDYTAYYRIIFLVAFFSLMFMVGAFAQTTVYSEDFNAYPDHTTDSDKWFTIAPGCNPKGNFEVLHKAFEAHNLKCEATWVSSSIDISKYSSVSAQVNITLSGEMEADDLVRLYYKLDDGPEQPFDAQQDLGNTSWVQNNLTGSSLQLVVKVINDHKSERVTIDDITVTGIPASSVSQSNGHSEKHNTAVPASVLHLAALAVESGQDKVHVSWSTSKEENTNMFYVERSLDGVEFTKVEAISAAGFSNNQQDYSTFDMEPYLGTAFYRIRQEDKNGNSSYSDIMNVTVTTTILNELIIDPNPNKGKFRLDIKSSQPDLNVLILDNLGQLVYMSEVTGIKDRLSMDVDVTETLPAGVYYVKMDVDDNNFVKRVVIE